MINAQAPKNKSSAQTIFWWVAWITLTIVSFFVAAAIWTPFIAAHFGSIRETRIAVLWVAAVFGTWLVILVPLIVVMYQKVDKAYEDARIRREKAALKFRSIFVPAEKRKLPQNAVGNLKGVPETIEGGYLTELVLKNGRHIPHVFVTSAHEILGIYNAHEMDFEGKDVQEICLTDMTAPPAFHATQWLRLDGVTSPE